MRKLFFTYGLLLLAVSCFAAMPALASTGLPNEISNLHFENTTQVRVDVVWTTAHPSTSQVLLARDTNYEPERWAPKVADPALVTTHRVTVDHLLSYNASGQGQWYIYVASVTASGQMSTAPGPQTSDGRNPLLSMRTLPPNPAGTPNFLVYTLGPTTAWTGHDTYFEVDDVLIAGPVTQVYIANTGGYNNGTDGTVSYLGGANMRGTPAKISPHLSCQWANPSGLDSAEQSFNRAKNMGFCYNGGNDLGYLSMRLRVAVDAAPGNYSLTFTLNQNGQAVKTIYPFTVVKTPTSIPVVGSKTVLPIPRLALWESEWVRLGNKWCDWRDSQNVAGFFVDNWGVSSDDWFYDGGRVFQQLDDYTANVLRQPNHSRWQHCAQALLDPYAYFQIANSGNMQGYSIFPAGLAMNYWRTRDAKMTGAVNALATVGPQHVSVGWVDPYGMREASYRSNMWMANTQLGAPVWPLLQRNIDRLIGMMDIVASDGHSADAHPFMVGIAAETLSRWYQFSVACGAPDYRVVPALKRALDSMWVSTWLPAAGQLEYNSFRLPHNTPVAYTDLNNLNVQGYAWLWFMTGDPQEQQHAFDLFQNALDSPGDYGWSGKQFSQMWEFSPDAVRLLQNNGASYTEQASNPYAGPWLVTTPPTLEKVNCDPNYYRGCKAGTIGTSTATIFWMTYVPATTQVFYGTTVGYGHQTSVANPSGVLVHSMTLTQLAPGTFYHFRAKSVDLLGNVAEMRDLTFSTLEIGK
jgi:hypothetical protein